MIFRILLIGISTIIAGSVYSQEGEFTKVEKNIEKGIRKSSLQDLKGWKFEHRWLDEFKKRTTPDGNFYNGEVFYSTAERLAASKLTKSTKMAGWIPVGPTERADQSLTKGLGRINCIAFHPSDANTYWVGVAQGGVWKTTDDGQNWTPLTDDLPILRISDIAIDPNNPDNIYICVGDYAYIDVSLSLDDRKRHTHYGIGVYRSTDGGTSWNPTGLTYELPELDGSLMRSVLINPNNSDSLVAAGTGGIWTSSDAGGTWSMKSDSLIWDFEQDPNDFNTIYASSGYLGSSQTGTAGIMKSTDFGDTWTWLNTGIPTTGGVLRTELAIAPSNSNHVYAITCDSVKGLYGVYTTLDGGTNWNFSDAGGMNILEWFSGTGSGGQGTYDLSIAVDPTDENLVYTGGVNIWGSTDGGSTFNHVSLWYDGYGPGLHADQHQFKFHPISGDFYVCNDGGLVRTDNVLIGSWDDANNIPGYEWPTTWEYMSDGMQTNSFYRIGLSEGNSGNFSAGAQDNSTYYNNGNNWINTFGGDGMETMLHPTNTDVIYGSSQYGRIVYSTNGGFGYNQMDGPSNEDGEWTTPFMYAPGSTNSVYAGFGNLYSAGPGNDFTNAHSNFSDMQGAGFPSPISHFNICKSSPNTIYVAKRIYHSYNQLSEFWRTDDNGASWTNVTAGLPDSLFFSYVAVDNDTPESVWVVTGGFEEGKHVYHSEDGGVNWENITYNLPNLPTNCIVHNDSSYYNTVYIGTDIGIYYNNDTLTEWIAYNDNLPNVIVSELEIHYGDGDIYAATFGRGVWKTDVLQESTVDDASIQENDLLEINLEVFPNPNNGQFELAINGYEGSQLELEIIDVMGHIVYNESLDQITPIFKKSLNLSIPDGMYFMKLSKENHMNSIRFIKN